MRRSSVSPSSLYTKGSTSRIMRGRNPGGRSGAGGDYQRRMMEDANNSARSALADQISQLKGMSQDILSEVEAQNELLDGMSGHMDQTGSMLGDTIGKLSGMLKKRRQLAHVRAHCFHCGRLHRHIFLCDVNLVYGFLSSAGCIPNSCSILQTRKPSVFLAKSYLPDYRSSLLGFEASLAAPGLPEKGEGGSAFPRKRLREMRDERERQLRTARPWARLSCMPCMRS